MSTTTYCQPKAFRFFAIQSALAFTCASFTVVPYESQLFQPIGGVAEGTPVDCAPAAGCMVKSSATTREAAKPMRNHLSAKFIFRFTSDSLQKPDRTPPGLDSSNESAVNASPRDRTARRHRRLSWTSETGRRETHSEERRVGKECRSRWSPYH